MKFSWDEVKMRKQYSTFYSNVRIVCFVQGERNGIEKKTNRKREHLVKKTGSRKKKIIGHQVFQSKRENKIKLYWKYKYCNDHNYKKRKCISCQTLEINIYKRKAESKTTFVNI